MGSSLLPLLLPFLLLISLVLAEEVVDPDFTYTAVSSIKVTPNSPLEISTTLHTAKSFPVEFKFNLENEKLVSHRLVCKSKFNSTKICESILMPTHFFQF
jgi:hypothetical protein